MPQLCIDLHPDVHSLVLETQLLPDKALVWHADSLNMTRIPCGRLLAVAIRPCDLSRHTFMLRSTIHLGLSSQALGM